MIAARRCLMLGLALAASGWAAAASAIETTYGEDPVPNSQCAPGNPHDDGFLYLGYGIDPIPAKNLTQRWREWRAARGLPGPPDIFHRQVGGGTTRPVSARPPASQPRSSARRGSNTPEQTRRQ